MSKNNTSKPRFQNILTVWRIIRIGFGERPMASIAYTLAVVTETASFLFGLFATAQLTAAISVFSAGDETSRLWTWLWLDVAAGAGIGLSFWVMNWAKRTCYFALVQWSTYRFMEVLCSLDIPELSKTETRNQINKVQAGYIWQIPNFYETSLDLIYAIVRFVATAIVVAAIAWWVIPVIAVCLLPTLFVERRLAKVNWFVWDSHGDWRHTFWGLEYIIRTIRGQMELRSLQARRYVVDKIKHMNGIFYGKQLRQLRSANVILGPAKLLENVGTAIGAAYLLRKFIDGALSLERYFFLSGALLRIGGALNNIFGTLSRLQESILFAQSYFELTDLAPTIQDKPNAKMFASNSLTPPRIEFRNMSFAYPNNSKKIFEKFSLVIEPGEHVALVGENGAGKSTLIKLLLRYYRPTAGKILIDNIDLQDIAIESLYERLATLFQSFNEYPLPIGENITIARSNINPDEGKLARAAKLAHVDTFVAGYKHAWETVLDSSFKKGVEPSGGQWQRVALARAFYRDAPILILDEPTSAIDAKAEYDIFNAIFDHYKNRTTLIISHRFSTVRRAHRIVVLDAGKIVEQGTHAELMEQKGLYHELFSKQAEGYKD